MGIQDDYTRLLAFKESDGLDWGSVLKEYGPVAFRLIEKVLDVYMDMDDDDRTILATWIMAAAFKNGFDTMPILFINGSKGSGKTRLEKIIAAILPESVMTLSLTESALFRINSEKRCLVIDEAEKGQINSKDKVNLTELLNACYKRGGQVPRAVRGKNGRYSVEYYDVYNPVVLANIYGLNSVVEDKSITIVLRKSRSAKSRIPERFQKDPVIGALRMWFGVCYAGLDGFLDIAFGHAGDASSLYNIIHTFNTYPTSSYTIDDGKGFLEKSAGLKVSGRDFELWRPLLEITYIFDSALTDRLILLAQERTKIKSEENAEFDRDTLTAIALYTYIYTLAEPKVLPKDFRDWYMGHEGITAREAEKHWLTPEWIGHFLKRCKIINKKGRTGRGTYYVVSKAKLQDYLEARDAFDEVPEHESSPKAPTPQRALDKESEPNAHSAQETPQIATIASTATMDMQALLRSMQATGLRLGHDFENAPETLRAELASMAHAGIIYEPQTGTWRYVDTKRDDEHE